MSSRKFAVLLAVLSMALPLYGAAARRGWTKIELSSVDGKGVPPDLLGRFGAELIADYGTYAIAYAPVGVVDALKAQAATEHVRVRARDELDQLKGLCPAVARPRPRGLPAHLRRSRCSAVGWSQRATALLM